MNFTVIYSEKQIANPNQDPIHGVISPSATKPKIIAETLLHKYPEIQFEEPSKLEVQDFYTCHDKNYVNDIFDKQTPNGFGTFSDSVNASLPYTNGAMFKACQLATPTRPACALVAGFHHAGYFGHEGFGYFCTFNGLMISAMKMIADNKNYRVAIIDCDMHHGNGTDDILDHLKLRDQILHISFGRVFKYKKDANMYIDSLSPDDGIVATTVKEFSPNLIIYQSGADVHVDDPMGGVLAEDQMKERDRRVFQIAKNSSIPLAWCLAGGYQVAPDGNIDTVVRLHMNTFVACEEIYGEK